MSTTTTAQLAAAIAAVDDFCGECTDDSKALVRAKVRGLLAGYHARWVDAGYEALGVERVYRSALWNPATQAKSRTFEAAGMIDLVARLNGTFLFDHKTTTLDITDPDAPYWRQLRVEGQVTHYLLLKWLSGEKLDGAVWDVTRKPSISPKKLSKGERASAVADRKYFGRILSGGDLMALQTEERETLSMYEARVAHDCTVERPEWYFQRRPVPRLDHELLEYAEDLWQHGQNILFSRKIERLPKNSGACMLYGSPCKFLGICSGHDSPDSDRWKRREIRHNELGESGRMDALTNSRIRCFQTCQVKHRFEYELCLERQDEEEKESLWFGSCYHAALNAWWRTFLVEDNDNVDSSETGSPTSEVGKHIAEAELSARDSHGGF